jgi:hypothetical protein
MADAEQMSEGTPEALEGRLMPPVDVSGAEHESDPEKINEIAFELYKEAASVVNLAAHLLDDEASAKGGWPRNQAICAGLMIRIFKFMLVVTQLSAKGDRAEVVSALNRSIMESSINLEFLVSANGEKFFDQFVKFSLGPERELYDTIQANISARGGKVLPIERRMLDSVESVCRVSDVKIEDLNRKYGDWGGGVRERLKALNKEERYVGLQRLSSHAIHGTWVDLYMNHLDWDSKTNAFSPHAAFSWVDERILGPIAIFVLEAAKAYIERFFAALTGSELILGRIDDLNRRLLAVGTVHERIMSKE